LAHVFVIGLVPKHSREDVAQDVTLECLIRMRAGEWEVAPEAVVSYVFRAVERKAIDYVRRRKVRKAHEEVFGREMEDGVHAWMRPDTSGADRELHALYTRTLESLPPACQRTYVMVREQGMTYEQVADVPQAPEIIVTPETRVVRLLSSATKWPRTSDTTKRTAFRAGV
jgi:RNA polymerase sigma factor (sigma-70 family)